MEDRLTNKHYFKALMKHCDVVSIAAKTVVAAEENESLSKEEKYEIAESALNWIQQAKKIFEPIEKEYLEQRNPSN